MNVFLTGESEAVIYGISRWDRWMSTQESKVCVFVYFGDRWLYSDAQNQININKNIFINKRGINNRDY